MQGPPSAALQGWACHVSGVLFLGTSETYKGSLTEAVLKRGPKSHQSAMTGGIFGISYEVRSSSSVSGLFQGTSH